MINRKKISKAFKLVIFYKIISNLFITNINTDIDINVNTNTNIDFNLININL